MGRDCGGERENPTLSPCAFLPQHLCLPCTPISPPPPLHSSSPPQAVGYYTGMLAYYWLLATPAMGFVFGLYLYLSVSRARGPWGGCMPEPNNMGLNCQGIVVGAKRGGEVRWLDGPRCRLGR